MSDNRPDGMKKAIRIYISILIVVTVGVTAWGITANTLRGRQAASSGNDAGGMRTFVSEAVSGAVNAAVSANGDGSTAGSGTITDQNSSGTADNTGSGSGASSVTGSWNADEKITSIDAETDLIDIRIVTGEEFHAEWGGENGMLPGIWNENGVLKIRQGGTGKTLFSLGSLNFGKTEQPWIRLTVPEDAVFDEISIKADCGDIRLDAVSSKMTDIRADLGDIRLDGGDLGRLTVKADCGNIELNSVRSDDAEIKADFGRISSYGCSHGLLDVKADCGQVKLEKVVMESGKVKAEMGDIEVSGDFPELEADCSLGRIDVTTDRPEQEVRLDLHTDAGIATVNGKDR